jgi:hypothetical protein
MKNKLFKVFEQNVEIELDYYINDMNIESKYDLKRCIKKLITNAVDVDVQENIQKEFDYENNKEQLIKLEKEFLSNNLYDLVENNFKKYFYVIKEV